MNVQSLADGQLAATQTAIFSQTIVSVNYPNLTLDPYRASINFGNTSGSLSETVQLFVQREGGTPRLIDYAILAPHEVRKITGIPMNPGDTLLAQTTDATTVDYVIWASADGIYTATTYTATGATKNSATTSGGALTITSASANALAVGPNGATNAVLNVDASTSSQADGIDIIGLAAGNGVTLVTTTSGTNAPMNISGVGSGNVVLNKTGTGITVFTTGAQITDAKNIVLGSSTGNIIGTATTQKLAFWNATPVVQPVANTDTTTGAAGSTTTVFLNTTFAGPSGASAYTIGGLVKALKAVGIIAA